MTLEGDNCPRCAKCVLFPSYTHTHTRTERERELSTLIVNRMRELDTRIARLDEMIEQTDLLLAMMRRERNEVSERILKLRTLRHGREPGRRF